MTYEDLFVIRVLLSLESEVALSAALALVDQASYDSARFFNCLIIAGSSSSVYLYLRHFSDAGHLQSSLGCSIHTISAVKKG